MNDQTGARAAIEAARRRMIESGVARPETIRGCGEAEIRQLEEATGLTLPAAYREFLRAFGFQEVSDSPGLIMWE